MLTKQEKIKTTAARYVIYGEQLYRTMGDWPLLKYITREGGNYLFREVHGRIYGSHIGTNALVWKVIRYD